MALFVQAPERSSNPALNAGDLGADQSSAVFEGFGVGFRPLLELPVVVQHKSKCLGLCSGVA